MLILPSRRKLLTGAAAMAAYAALGTRPALASSSFAYISSAQGVNTLSYASVTTNPNVTVTGQNLLLLLAGDAGGGVSSVVPVDSSSNSYIQDYYDSNSFSQNAIYHVLGGAGSTGFNWTGGVNFGSVIGAAFSGAAASSVVDNAATPIKPASVANGTFTIGPVTASTPGCLFIAAFTYGGPPSGTVALNAASVTDGWATAQSVNPGSGNVAFIIAYKIEQVATPAAQSCSFDTTGSVNLTGVGQIQAYRPASYSPPVTSANSLPLNVITP